MTAAISRRTASAALFGLGLAGPAAAGVAPRRVVSLGQCLDTVLMHVADRGQIAAITYRSRDPLNSPAWEIARTLPVTYETAEEVVGLQPDLVLASKRSALAARTTLKGLGYRVEEFPVPDSVSSSIAQIREIGRLVGRQPRAEALVARIEAALAAAAPSAGAPPVPALIYQRGGLVAGEKTLIGEMMERCGLENVAARYGVKKWAKVPLERLLADPPKILLLGEARVGVAGGGERILAHPALAALEPRMHRVIFPVELLYCGGPLLIRTAAALTHARQATERRLAA
ncbi:ABC transporter substrate-binding protein [Phenylobacterium sp. LjRoot219]|uniref:ABC transporter substrate-binding protein n=1 Tax=Phenylobacterium sp. LjRoot219 TaxID=3342283 RepID=UPI003ECCA05F